MANKRQRQAPPFYQAQGRKVYVDGWSLRLCSSRRCFSRTICIFPLALLTLSQGQSEPLWTFSIVTTSANKDFSWLHERQPVILSTREALDRWLDTSSQQWTKDLEELVLPYHDTSSPLQWCVRTTPHSYFSHFRYYPAIQFQRKWGESAQNPLLL